MGDDGESNDDGFVDYVPSTRDPGPFFVKFAVAYLMFVVVSLWPLVFISRKWRKERKRQRAAERAAQADMEAAKDAEWGEQQPLVYTCTPQCIHGDAMVDDTILDPQKPRRVVSRILHNDEYGRSGGQQLELYQTSVLDAFPFFRHQSSRLKPKHVVFDDEDTLSEHAFVDYYAEHAEDEDTDEDCDGHEQDDEMSVLDAVPFTRHSSSRLTPTQDVFRNKDENYAKHEAGVETIAKDAFDPRSSLLEPNIKEDDNRRVVFPLSRCQSEQDDKTSVASAVTFSNSKRRQSSRKKSKHEAHDLEGENHDENNSKDEDDGKTSGAKSSQDVFEDEYITKHKEHKKKSLWDAFAFLRHRSSRLKQNQEVLNNEHAYYAKQEEGHEEGQEVVLGEEEINSAAMDNGMVTRGCTTFCNVIWCDKETIKIFKLALPGTFSAVTSSFLDAATTALIAKNLGPEAYTAYAMVGVFLGITDSFVGGVGSAETTLVSQAIGMKNYFMAGQYVQLTTVLYILTAIPTYWMWVQCIETVLLKLGFGEDIAQYAADYTPIAIFSYFINGIKGCLSTLLWSSGYATHMAVIDAYFHVIYVMMLGVAILCFNAVDLVVIAWIGIAYGLLYGVFVFIYTTSMGWLTPYWKGMFHNLAILNCRLIWGVMKMSIPLSIGSLMSYGEWQILTFLAAYMGPAEVAAWSIGGAIWSVFEYTPGGIGIAAEIRIAFHLGNGNPRMAKISAYRCIFYSTVWSSLITYVFMRSSDEIISCFTVDPTLTSMLQEMVVLIGLGNVPLCVGHVAYYIVTAQTRAHLATLVYFCCAWCITIPLSAILVLVVRFGLQAIVTSVVLGYGTVTLVLLTVVFISNWAKISKQISDETKAETESDSYRSPEPTGELT